MLVAARVLMLMVAGVMVMVVCCGRSAGASKRGELGLRTHMLAGVHDELALDGPHSVLLVLHTREM